MKFTAEFKLQVVRQYLDGHDGTARTAQAAGVSRSLLRMWVNAYEVHGSSGLSPKRGRYSPEFRLQVLQHMWDNELSYKQITATFNLGSPTTISLWERRYRAAGVEGLNITPRRSSLMPTLYRKPENPPPDEQRSREDILAELNYLRMENAVLKKLEALAQARKKTRASAKRK